MENLKSQVRTLFRDLQQAQSKLDDAEGMKKNLQDRSATQTRFFNPTPQHVTLGFQKSVLTLHLSPVEVSGAGAGCRHPEGSAAGETSRPVGERPAEAAAGQRADAEPGGAEESRGREVGVEAEGKGRSVRVHPHTCSLCTGPTWPS